MVIQDEVLIENECAPQQVCVCSNEVIVRDIIEIPPQKPEKEKVLEIDVAARVIQWKTIDTPLGKKIIVHGELCIGLEYVANLPEQSVHFAHFCVQWDTFFLCSETFCDVTVCVEHFQWEQLDHRRIEIMAVLLVCAKPCPPPPPCQPVV